jgi:hypothetical protein
MTPDRQARAQRLGPYFEVQLQLARRMAELRREPLSCTALRYTNFHRRFGLRTPPDIPTEPWLTYADGLDCLTDLKDQVGLTQQTFLVMPEEILPPPPKQAYGCFAHDPPDAAGVIQIHFNNADTDSLGGPLAYEKQTRRRADLAAMVEDIRARHPDARAIRGRSWLYNLGAYRRLFPADYAASATPETGVINLHGNSSWGQMIDSREAVRPDFRDILLANLDGIDPEAPWRAFPLQVLRVRAPIASFEAFYGL